MRKKPSVLSMVCVLWLLNSAIGARAAVKEGLPAEWVAGLYVGRDASAEFFKGTGTALSPGLPMMVAQALLAVLSTRGGWAGKIGAAGLTLLGAGGHRRGSGGDDNLQGPFPQDVRFRQGTDRLSGHNPLGADDHPRCESAARSEERSLRESNAGLAETYTT